MGSLSEVYIKKETLKTLLSVLDKKGDQGVAITISISDETNDYSQNLSAWVSQSKEQRESGLKKFYVGNGKCFWTDGKISIAEKRQTNQSQPQQQSNGDDDGTDDLPF